jgi:hypothetical protein
MPDLVLQKYMKIDAEGREALRNGTVKVFTGFPMALANRFGVSLMFDEASERLLWDCFCTQLSYMEDAFDFELYMALRDFPAYTPVLEGLYKGGPLRRRAVYKEVASFIKERFPLDTLFVNNFTYKWVLAAGGNIILTGRIPPLVLGARKFLETAYTQHGLEPLDMTNIFHITLGRLVTPIDPELVEDYLAQIDAMREDIIKDPIDLKVANVRLMPAYSLVNSSWRRDLADVRE